MLKQSGITNNVKGSEYDMLPSKLFNDFFDNMNLVETNNLKCDIYEKDDVYHIEMDIPGFKKEEINVDFHKGNLTVTAEKKNEEKEEEKNYIRRERTYGKYVRSFYVGEIDEDKIEAKFQDGILEIILPKKEASESKKLIEIK